MVAVLRGDHDLGRLLADLLGNPIHAVVEQLDDVRPSGRSRWRSSITANSASTVRRRARTRPREPPTGRSRDRPSPAPGSPLPPPAPYPRSPPAARRRSRLTAPVWQVGQPARPRPAGHRRRSRRAPRARSGSFRTSRPCARVRRASGSRTRPGRWPRCAARLRVHVAEHQHLARVRVLTMAAISPFASNCSIFGSSVASGPAAAFRTVSRRRAAPPPRYPTPPPAAEHPPPVSGDRHARAARYCFTSAIR